VRATPFGVRMPPRPVFDSKGQQVGTEEWPIGDLQVLSAHLNWSHGQPRGTAVVSIQGPGDVAAQQARDIGSLPLTFSLGNLGEVEVTAAPSDSLGGAGGTPDAGTPHRDVITVDFKPHPSSGLAAMTVTLAPADGGSYVVTFGDGSTFTWTPAQVDMRFTVGNQRVSIGWTTARPALLAEAGLTEFEGRLTVSVAEAMKVAHPDTLDLDTTYPGIVPGSWVVIQNAADTAGSPVVARVTAATTTAVARYGMSGTVTQLILDRHWVDPDSRWLSALRPLSVRAQPTDLTLLPVALPGPLGGSTIDLAGLYAGIETGRRILVTGTRVDLPGGATVPAGEPAMVAGVTQQAAAGGDTPHTTLHLTAKLAYSYELRSARIYGNVVPAHQGATVTEPLTGAVPGDPSPSFTLSQAPVLADPSPTASGFASSLRLSVGGRAWTPATRLDASTPADSYQTGIDSQGRTTVELSGPLPTGTSNVVATYRTGQGSAGNVRAHQVTQLLSRPLTVAGVDNPLPGSGGSDGDGPGDLRAGAPVGLVSLGRLVSVPDAADLVRSWAGVGKASAVLTTDSGGEVIALTVAGTDPVALDQAGELCTDLRRALAANGDPTAPVAVLPARLYVLVLAARIRSDPALDWADVSGGVRAALVGAFGYARRRLGQDLVISEITAVAHSVPGVESFAVTGLQLIPSTATASDIERLTARLPAPPASGRLTLPRQAAAGQAAPGLRAAAVAYLSDAMTDTLILQRVVR